MSADSPTIAVVDVETTGFSPKIDRVVEIAVLLTTVDGEVVDQFATLVNPQRHVSASEIHGLTATLLSTAPTFAEVAPYLAHFLSRGSVLAGHNVSFDLRMLAAEFARAAVGLADRPSLCTMSLAGGGRLAYCCELYGIPLRRETHDAFEDCRATASLLATLLRDDPRNRQTVLTLPAPRIGPAPLRGRSVSRAEANDAARRTPSAISQLLSRADLGGPYEDDNPSALAYANLLERALEDRIFSTQEVHALEDLATTLELDGTEIRGVHRRILDRLIQSYLADTVLAKEELTDLQNVARLLGIGDELAGRVAQVKQAAAFELPVNRSSQSIRAGMSVCFTGEIEHTYKGRSVTREDVERLATDAGLVVKSSVSKKLDLLVCADPATESGKAKKARLYGVRAMHAAEFLLQLPTVLAIRV